MMKTHTIRFFFLNQSAQSLLCVLQEQFLSLIKIPQVSCISYNLKRFKNFNRNTKLNHHLIKRTIILTPLLPPKQFLGKVILGGLPLPSQHSVQAAFRNLRVPVLARLLFNKDTVGWLMFTKRDTQFNGYPRDDTLMMNHLACEAPGWKFIAGSVLESRLDSLE